MLITDIRTARLVLNLFVKLVAFQMQISSVIKEKKNSGWSWSIKNIHFVSQIYVVFPPPCRTFLMPLSIEGRQPYVEARSVFISERPFGYYLCTIPDIATKG